MDPKKFEIKYVILCETPIGTIGIEEYNSSISRLYLSTDHIPQNLCIKDTPLLQKAKFQLIEYLEGKRESFDLPLAPHGTDFQHKVWEALQSIPFGETRSYKQIADAVGNPKASRAVGMANNKNPIAIFIPCHRVIGANGSLVGYGGGLRTKQYLLDLEKK